MARLSGVHGRLAAIAVLFSLLGLGLVACGGAPLRPATDLQPRDLQRLAGTWTWSTPFESPGRLGPGPIKVRVEGGQLLFESATASGTLTLHEDGNKRVLRGEGRDKADNRRFPVQLTQRTSGPRPPATGGSADHEIDLTITE